MAILIGALEFDGPVLDIDMLSGIYAVLCQNGEDLELLDLGETDYVREDLLRHAERDLWSEQGLQLAFAVHYTADLTPSERRELKEALDLEFNDQAAA
jgi:hypothetical protein